jgi:DGQHR domain-containing protein
MVSALVQVPRRTSVLTSVSTIMTARSPASPLAGEVAPTCFASEPEIGTAPDRGSVDNKGNKRPMTLRKKVPIKRAGPRRPANLTFPCVIFEQAGKKAAAFALSGKQLWELVEINRRKEDKDEGYQRALAPARVAKVAKFIDEKNLLPTVILISFDDGTIGDGTLTIPNRADSGWVIDGQHRLAGAHTAVSDMELPIVAFVGLSETEQINLFVTINQEQKGVPTSLYYELLPKLPNRMTTAQALRMRAKDLADILKNDEESPFYHRIVSTTSPTRGQLSLTNFLRTMGPHLRLNAGALSHYNDDDRRKIVNNYYRALELVFPKEYRDADSIFFKTLGFGALMNTLPKFIHHGTHYGDGLRVGDFRKILSHISDFDFAAWHGRGTGSASENSAAADVAVQFDAAVAPKTGATRVKLD